MEQKVKKMNAFLEAEGIACRERSRTLFADHRRDEGTFEKIKGNVYDIFKAVLAASIKAHSNDPEAAKVFFLRKLNEIPSAWVTSREKAIQHGETDKQLIEELKLSAAQQIKEKFTEIWEETP